MSSRTRSTTVTSHTLTFALFVLRESARKRSPYMAYLHVVLSHGVDSVPMTWEPGSARLQRASRETRSLASSSRSQVLRYYEALVPPAIERFPRLLSEGLDCATASAGGGARTACTREALEKHYSVANFVRVYAILAARDWALPVYGQSRHFLAPIVDMFNFGQVGIRAEFDDTRHAFVVTASEPIAAGTELLFYYGSQCRESSINMYGFAPSEARPCNEAAAANKGVAANMAAKHREDAWKTMTKDTPRMLWISAAAVLVGALVVAGPAAVWLVLRARARAAADDG